MCQTDIMFIISGFISLVPDEKIIVYCLQLTGTFILVVVWSVIYVMILRVIFGE